MPSEVSICNLALANLGKKSIVALTEKSTEAIACNMFYEHTRDVLLQAYPWHFAGKTASLAEVTNDKPGRWGYAYNRPVDCLKIRWVRPEYSSSEYQPATVKEELAYPHEVEGGVIYSDLTPAFLRYTWPVSDPSMFSPLFVDALAWHLSVRLAVPLTRDPKMRADMFDIAQSMQAAAQAADANEQRESTDHASDFVEARD